jgi:hypothetical protein
MKLTTKFGNNLLFILNILKWKNYQPFSFSTIYFLQMYVKIDSLAINKTILQELYYYGNVW